MYAVINLPRNKKIVTLDVFDTRLGKQPPLTNITWNDLGHSEPYNDCLFSFLSRIP